MDKKILQKDNAVVIYGGKGGPTLRVRLEKETVWLSLNQLANLFDTDKSGVSRHIKNIYGSGELSEKATVAVFATVQKEGGRSIRRAIEYYNLDMILSVGYRVNSKKATHFRQWATRTLRQYVVDGYALNRARIAENYDAFQKAIAEVRALLPSGVAVDTGSVLGLVSAFAGTWVSLDAYDRNILPLVGATKKPIQISVEELSASLEDFKKELFARGEASELFGAERDQGAIAGIVGNCFQSFERKDLYPSVEEKAAHLLYFLVKDHPFLDGNKRSGAYAFVWFLRRAKLLNTARITPEALTALTLLIAESDPKNKDRMIRLVLQLLKK